MSIQVELVGINGTLDYFIPEYNDTGWAQGNGNLTDYLVALSTATLQNGTGSFPLTATLDFGSSFGIKVKSISSESTNPATTGYLSLSNSDVIAFRNDANTNNLSLGVNTSDQLTFNGTPIGATTSLADGKFLIGNVSNLPTAQTLSGDITSTDTGVITISNNAVTNAKVSTTAAIARSKLASGTNYVILVNNSSGVMSENAALTASKAVVSDANGQLASSTVSTTTLAFLDATSSVQTQLNGLLPLSGGTMSGILNMGSHVISSVTQGSSTGQAVSFPVGTAQISAGAVSQVVNSASGSTSDLGNTATTASIVTSGGKVLIFASCRAAFSTSGSSASLDTRVTRGGTSVTGAAASSEQVYPTGNAAWSTCHSITAVDSPAAGTYTYNYTYSTGGTLVSLQSFSLVLVELKV